MYKTRDKTRAILAGLLVLMLLPLRIWADDVIEFVAGPMKVGSGCHKPDEMPKQYIPVRFEKDVWVIKSEYELVDKDGEELPNQLLCHSVIASREHLHNVVAMPELAWDSTKPEIVFPHGTGVLMKANTEYQWEVIWKNPYGKEYPEGYMKLKLHTRPVDASSDLKNLVTDCVSVYPDHPAGLYYVPKGKSRKEREVRFAYEGKAMMFGGHIHQHGTKLALEKMSADPAKPNEIVWEGKFEGDVHNEFKLPATVLETPLEIQKSDLYKLVVDYDNTSQRDWPAMGFVCALTVPKV